MNTLDDLRSTLDREATSLHDHAHWARPAAVRGRIRTMRRRRAATAASAAAVVLVAAAAVAGPVLHHTSSVQPAGRVAGVDLPGKVSVYGFPYRLADTRETTGGDRVRLGKTDSDRALTLAASGLGTGSATLYVDGEPVARAFRGSDVGAPYPISTGSPTVRVVLHGAPAGARAGVGVYDATGGLAHGTSNGTAVFRDRLAGSPLLAAGFSEPGRSSVDLEVRGAMDALRLAFYCTATDDKLWMQVAVDGHPGTGSSCGGAGPDAALGTSTTTDHPSPVREHHLHVTLTRGAEGPRISPDDVTFGLGVYARTATTQRVLGSRVEQTTEWGGRTWVLERVLPGPAVTVDTAHGDRLIGLVARGTASASWRGDLSHGSTGTIAGGRTAGILVGGVLLAGDRYDVTAHGGSTRLLVYRPE